jgi:hypothetical protein
MLQQRSWFDAHHCGCKPSRLSARYISDFNFLFYTGKLQSTDRAFEDKTTGPFHPQKSYAEGAKNEPLCFKPFC